MQIKKLMASLGVLICLFSNSFTVAYANDDVPFINNEISLLYEIAVNPSSYLSIVDKTAYCISSVDGSNAVSITATQTLQKHWGLWFWEDVKGAKWTGTNAYNSICLSNSKGGLDSGTYRVKSVFTLTNKDGKNETITIYSSEQVVS